nr:hypothetical protein [Chroococcidiopsis sp. CCMEE 29]
MTNGGFSQTYVAEDIPRPGSPKCVVKHLKPASSDANFLQKARRLFQSEAETLEKLVNNDHIPRLLAYFEENGTSGEFEGKPLFCSCYLSSPKGISLADLGKY